MNNVYKVPKSDLVIDDFLDLSNAKKIVATGCALVSFLIYLVIYKAVPQFTETFSAFGADLPELTLLVLNLYGLYIWLCLLSLLPLFVWFKLKLKYRIRLYIVRCSIVYALFTIALFPIVVYSMYLPIFNFGGVD